jgi:hypothetical protein
MNLDIKIEGLEEAQVKFRLLDQAVRTNGEKAMMQACMIVQRRAKENISGDHGHTRHVKTGNLRRNIKSKAGWTGLGQIDGVIGTDVPYAPYVEALPDGGYLFPALMEVGKDALDFFNRAIVAAILGKPIVPQDGGSEE